MIIYGGNMNAVIAGLNCKLLSKIKLHEHVGNKKAPQLIARCFKNN